MRANIGFQFSSNFSDVINGDSDNDDDDDNDSDADFTSFLQDMKKNVSRQIYADPSTSLIVNLLIVKVKVDNLVA